ncbi:deoxyribonuclease V [Oryzomicrobium terrae]|uniref:Endonuclease V n=1 Tax=Oryzomicrobium terrae TaxID=1735038 RepID=A0A5C1E8F5_9RHOO|nr:deoxyribonuclease V [Oryzomicrobium terrae]QEL65241.1 deoxyribonuclease V [Oryzomicrobium terrae]
MHASAPHPEGLTPSEAIAWQRRQAPRVETTDRLPALAELTRVAGVDVGFEDLGRITRAAVAVLSYPDLQPVEQAIARLPTTFPYIPGLLSFREAPAVLAALAQLSALPEVLLVDGQGLAHPRRFGLACHLGVLTDLPAIGVGKTRLTGTYVEPGQERGAWSPLEHKGETIGAVLRSRSGVAPLFISIGHRISLPTALALTMACTRRYRLPETTRAAHRLASG